MTLTQQDPLQPLSTSQQETVEEAVGKYHLAATAQAVEWLERRKISTQTADTFRLGVVTDPSPGHERFRGMLSIPYLDKDGIALTVRFRCIEDHDHREHFHGKYMSIPEDRPRMFNIGAVHRAENEIHVTEGEFDAMILSQLGLHAVGIPGSQGFAGHHRRMLAGFSRIWVWGDPDDAGADFTNGITRRLRSAKGVKLPGTDVNDTYLQGGATAILSLFDPEY